MSYRLQLAEVDLGNLLFEDKAPLEIESKKELEPQLQELAHECLSHFFKLFWALPTERIEGVTISTLPKPAFRLPREKRVPFKRDLTRWEQFAKLKGIKNKKKSRKVWDPNVDSWRPRWGKDRVDNLKDKWVLEVPDNADPYEDQFAKLTSKRKELRAKNEFQRLRNIARSVRPGQAPAVGVLAESQGSKNEFARALSIAKLSDASGGRFAAPLNERKISKSTEKKVKRRLKLSQVVGANAKKTSGKKRNSQSKKKTVGKKALRAGNKK
ncbi:hypothetical protein P879_06008 [Paragonimus westermani]|uniref:Ribosome biogenesis regulatory protein n=1 Tax=Paragonimus westermani TaxID=34504 RepID=A0A8T0CZT8_9TREM|nr:hypothetical protein P879_06008 [Paragonimus westermani]